VLVRQRWVAAALVIATIACAPRQQLRGAATDSPGSSAERRASTAGGRAIWALRQRHSQAIAARDTQAIAAIYAQNVLYLPHGQRPEQGRQAVRDAWVRRLSAPDLLLEYRPAVIQIARSGDLAYERGTVWVKEPGAFSLTESGNYLYVWEKDDGQWKVSVWMWNAHTER